MIKVTGRETVIAGTLDEIISELTNVMRTIYEHMVKALGEEEALKTLALIGKITVMSKEEYEEEVGCRQKLLDADLD